MKNAILTILGVVMICIMISLVITKSKQAKISISDYFLCIGDGLGLGIVSGLGLVVILSLLTFNSTSYTSNIKTEEKRLVSMQFNNNISGKFLLGTGSIDNTDYIVFYTRKGDEIIRNKEEASDVKIIITNKEPKVIVTEREKIMKTECIFGSGEMPLDMTPNIEVHIPEKSIIENINLN
ncbi:MAG: hypothetical protein ACRCVJ_18570 [Clostridium sp.]|uniref:hypothetical protein n=1 Tax=Clostridium sp. TaxID=1506 RepID=UPI003F38DB15